MPKTKAPLLVAWISISGGIDDDALRDALGVGPRLLCCNQNHTYHIITPGHEVLGQNTDSSLATINFTGPLPLYSSVEEELVKYFDGICVWAEIRHHSIGGSKCYITVD